LPIDTLKPGIKPPDEINVVVEIPKGSSIKYEIDPKSGEISVDRMLFPAIFYPCNYGFIPQTKEEQVGDDGAADPIDVFILGDSSLLPKSVISCRPVGVLLTVALTYIGDNIAYQHGLHFCQGVKSVQEQFS
jgi:inorganic pyrophosphatase